jgi:hypothetical protein
MQIRAMLAKGEIERAQDFHDASFLFQHGESADDYLFAHILAIEAVIRGDNSSKWIVAATLDRYLQIIGKPQIFGTQYPSDSALPAKPDTHQNPFQGRTQSPFNDQFVPAAMRRDFCVPDLEQQKKNLQSLNDGHYPDSTMVAPGCTR